MHLSLPRKVINDHDLYEFENRMYKWTETPPETCQKRGPGPTGSGAPSLRSGSRSHRADDDIEAQVGARYPRPRSPDELYYQNAAEGIGRHRRARDMDARSDNWRLKSDGRRGGDDHFGDADSSWEARGANFGDGSLRRELQRSKSTPDMLDGAGKPKTLEIWPGEVGPRRNSSMAEVNKQSWSVYNDQQEADSLNEPQFHQQPVASPEIPAPGKTRRFPSGKNFFGQFLSSAGASPTANMFSNTEPYSQFWVTLSNVYGQALVILMLAFTLTEVMDNSVKLLSLQGIYLMYLYVGSIAVIICIYIWVLIDSCSSIQNDSDGLVTRAAGVVRDREPDLQNMTTLTKFGSLKKAHISRDRTSKSSFYLRIGAIVFGLGTLVFNGLEMAMHSMMEGSCLNDVVFVHPILHGLFTFLQMHFLFVNSQVLVERFGLAARFGFMHLAATNLALWIRLVVWDSGNEWTHYVYLSQNGIDGANDVPNPLFLRGFPKFITRKERASDPYHAVSSQHVTQVVSLHQCLNTNSLGQLWTSSMPFLYPFIIQFSIIAAAVTYIMGQNVAKDHLFFQKQKKIGGADAKASALSTLHDGLSTWGVDCSGASKGLFLGILCLVTGVVVIIIFLVVKENEDFPPDTVFWLTCGTLITILSITIVMNVIGLIQVRKLSVVDTKMPPLHKILSVGSVLGVQVYTIMGIVVGAAGVAVESDQEIKSPTQKRHSMLLALSIIQLLQAIMQSCFMVEGIRRTCLSRTQVLNKPARQVVTFLMFSNAVLWAFDTFVVQSWASQELQLRFYGVLVWGVVSRVSLPLLIFFRFHSGVLLLEIWKKSYQSLHLDPGN